MTTTIRRWSGMVIVSSLVALLASCGGIGGGGGGGGGSENFEGDFYLDLERDHIDSGDLNKISVEVANLNPEGAILKLRVSRSLRYVPKSAVFFPNRDEQREVEPNELVPTDNERFIVFFLNPKDAIGGEYVSIELTLRAVAGDKEGFIELDLDNNDPAILDSREFSGDTPKFTAKERRSIYIEPDSTMATATPTAAASGTAASGSGGVSATPAATATAAVAATDG
jgi:hypothetical protein